MRGETLLPLADVVLLSFGITGDFTWVESAGLKLCDFRSATSALMAAAAAAFECRLRVAAWGPTGVEADDGGAIILSTQGFAEGEENEMRMGLTEQNQDEEK